MKISLTHILAIYEYCWAGCISSPSPCTLLLDSLVQIWSASSIYEENGASICSTGRSYFYSSKRWYFILSISNPSFHSKWSSISFLLGTQHRLCFKYGKQHVAYKVCLNLKWFSIELHYFNADIHWPCTRFQKSPESLICLMKRSLFSF